MRWLLILIIVLLLGWQLMPDPEPVPIEKTFIAEPVQRLEDAKALEQQYLEADEARKQRLEDALEGDG